MLILHFLSFYILIMISFILFKFAFFFLSLLWTSHLLVVFRTICDSMAILCFISSKYLFFTVFITPSVMFYDWDDTLFPSTYLTKKNYRLDTTEIDEVTSNELRRLEAIVINLMNISLALGDVVIVTNGEHGWVELSAYKYFPTFAQDVLPKLQVRSARTTFQNHFPDSPLKWKVCWFFHESLKRCLMNCFCYALHFLLRGHFTSILSCFFFLFFHYLYHAVLHFSRLSRQCFWAKVWHVERFILRR